MPPGTRPDMGAREDQQTLIGFADGASGLPSRFTLTQNYPTPFKPSRAFKYELRKASMVKLIVYDLLGREVSLLVKESRDAGIHEVKFDGSNLASGVYLCCLTAGEFIQTCEVVLVR